MGDQAPSDRTVRNWYHEFDRNNFSVEDAARSGRPRTAINEETIDAVKSIIEDDPHSTYEEMEHTLGIGSSAVNSIIHEYLKLHKICTRWVPHQLTDGQKQFRIQFCRDSLERFEGGQSRHVFDIITGDESWFYHYDPTTKEQSKVWVSQTDPRPTKVHRYKSSGKRMVAIFFMKSGLIKSIPFERDETTGLRGLILHDATARTINESLADNRVEPYRNPPYSPDLRPCGFFLFAKLKNQLRGIRFDDEHAMLNALEQAIGSLTKDDFKNCFDDWLIRMHKCIDADEQYFEKLH
ncbi:unnamed protein product [Didymodactylos carnosus]|uniref:Transposase n=1 Tax=Didymodactylos carnosus TaxID=1234261 RepID=A0A814YHX1_9BILA|nr:unnamed protein product [Didymodactylos carnosus]CAF1230591.1 unnamed protein product [Didymodactylos carnosus]CAF3748173.1 unnamed protein product [Didymodactylos carnosus]CAF3993271.1 unnamed protein product [Didymodactylos carnosus]